MFAKFSRQIRRDTVAARLLFTSFAFAKSDGVADFSCRNWEGSLSRVAPSGAWFQTNRYLPD